MEPEDPVLMFGPPGKELVPLSQVKNYQARGYRLASEPDQGPPVEAEPESDDAPALDFDGEGGSD